jgi:hypothetical protein
MELILNIFFGVFVTAISGDFSAKREEQTDNIFGKNEHWISNWESRE